MIVVIFWLQHLEVCFEYQPGICVSETGCKEVADLRRKKSGGVELKPSSDSVVVLFSWLNLHQLARIYEVDAVVGLG